MPVDFWVYEQAPAYLYARSSLAMELSHAQTSISCIRPDLHICSGR
jgi:hypothetical protein